MAQAMYHVEASFWFALQGPIQDINPAEIMAPVVAIWHGGLHLAIHTDSGYFVNGWLRGPEWCTSPGRKYADIWRLFWEAASDFGTENIQVNKVKGHASVADVEAGKCTEFERWGNGQVQQLSSRNSGPRAPLGPERRSP